MKIVVENNTLKKISIWGKTRAGKTAFPIGIYFLRNIPAVLKKWSFIPSDDILEIAYKIKEEGKFSYVPTDKAFHHTEKKNILVRKDYNISFNFNIKDFSGAYYVDITGIKKDKKEALDMLSTSDGIIWCFDPFEDYDIGKTLKDIIAIINQLTRNNRRIDIPTAFCITKIDYIPRKAKDWHLIAKCIFKEVYGKELLEIINSSFNKHAFFCVSTVGYINKNGKWVANIEKRSDSVYIKNKDSIKPEGIENVINWLTEKLL